MGKIKISSLSSASIYVLYALLFFSMLFVYKYFIVVIYSYVGYVDDLSIGNIPISLLLIVLCLICVRRPGEPSYFFLHLGLSFVITPSLVLYTGGSLPINFALISVSAFALIGIIVSFNVQAIKFPGIDSHQLLIILAFVCLAFIGSLLFFGGTRFINFDLSRVYDFRSDSANNLPSLFGYLNPMFGKVVIPFAIVFAMLRSRWLIMTILVGCSVLLFALTAHKAPLFYPVFLLFVYWAAGQSSNTVKWLLLALLVILAISSIDFWLYLDGEGGCMFGNLFARRSIFTTSLLNWFYLDWFSAHEKNYWSSSTITFGLFSSPSSLHIANLIGFEYFNDEDSSANTGWIGSGYANAGLFGVYFYSFLIGLLFSFLNAYGRKLGGRLVISLFTIPVLVMLRSADLTTMFITHGLLIAIFILMMMSPENNLPHARNAI